MGNTAPLSEAVLNAVKQVQHGVGDVHVGFRNGLSLRRTVDADVYISAVLAPLGKSNLSILKGFKGSRLDS